MATQKRKVVKTVTFSGTTLGILTATTGAGLSNEEDSAAAFGDVLIKDAVKAYPNLIKQAKEVFPDIDFGEVAAEAAAEEV